MKLSEYAKAIVAGLAAGVVMFFTLREGGLTGDEWATIAASVASAAGITWAVPNKPQEPTQ
jgi:hypothetical protein